MQVGFNIGKPISMALHELPTAACALICFSHIRRVLTLSCAGCCAGYAEGARAGFEWGVQRGFVKTLEVFVGQVSGTSGLQPEVRRLHRVCSAPKAAWGMPSLWGAWDPRLPHMLLDAESVGEEG